MIESKKLLDSIYKMYPDASCSLDYTDAFTLLCAIMLSAQTTDKHVNQITPKLFLKYKTPECMAAASMDDIIEIIKPLGLAKSKAKYLIELSKMIVNKYDSVIPKDIKELETLPGVGHKTASVYLSEIYHEPHIAVDTHVFRVSNRLGIASASNVTKTEKDLMDYFEEEDYIKAHHGLLFLGRYCCLSKNPKCNECDLKIYCKEWNVKNGKKI